jgi:hypothetical protein
MKHILITKTYKKQRVFVTLSTQRYLYWVELVDSWPKKFGFKSSSLRIDAARQMNAATKRAARAAQSAEQQQVAREQDASARRAARAAQFA